jgi:hypothetical protein
MTPDLRPALRPDLFGQLAATDPYQRRARRLFERGLVTAVYGNQADVLVGRDAQGNDLELKQVPIVSGYVPQVGDWAAIQYEAGHSGAPWVVGPSMAADVSGDAAGIGVFPIWGVPPADPPKSMIYFDDSLDTWRGWDGSAWVDFFAKLHNALPDLQGGTAGQYYHFTAGEHSALQDFYDGSAMASGYLQQLCFKAIDASATSRTRLFEKNGDFFWAINADYDPVADQWNRIDTSKYAYLIGLYSENGIPHEPGGLGGVAWWRAVDGTNPIGDYTAVGGWELGFMMTMHRNFVGGGMNWELDGSGSPPYGRFSQSGHEDPDCFTGLQRNIWYEGNPTLTPGAGSWGRDTTEHDGYFMGMLDGVGFIWRYQAAGAGSFPTSAWRELGRLRADASVLGRLEVLRQSGVTNTPGAGFLAKHVTSADMADGFGAGYLFAIQDNAGAENLIAALYGIRAGADSTGRLSFQVASAGSLAERMSLSAGGVLSLADASIILAGNALSVEAASAVNQDLTTDSYPTLASLYIRRGSAYPFIYFEGNGVGIAQVRGNASAATLMVTASGGSPTWAYFSATEVAPGAAAGLNLGTATNYWNEINYKTLTDRGCLGDFSDGVEMPDGSVLSDMGALQAIKVDPGQETVYGVPRLLYSSMPKAVYKPAPIAAEDVYETHEDQDGKPYPVLRWKAGEKMGEDGAELTALVSIMLGGMKELDLRVGMAEKRLTELKS